MSVVKSLIATSLAFGLVSVLGCSDDSDTTPPLISSLSHTDKVLGSSRTINFVAVIEDQSSLTVTITHNDVAQTVTANTANETYSASITLEDNSNNIVVVTATDSENFESSQTVTLNYPVINFSTGQAASVVIGQANFDETSQNQGAVTQRGVPLTLQGNYLSSPSDVKVIENKLYISDSDNYRVLGFNSIPTAATPNPSADFVIGHDSVNALRDGSASGNADNQFNQPTSIAATTSYFFVAHGSPAVKIWSSIPDNNIAADLIVGQTDFDLTAIGCEQGKFGGNVKMFVAANKLIVSDTDNNRVLIWNSIPTMKGELPNIVLGQKGFDTCVANDDAGNGTGGTRTAKTLNRPGSVWSDGERLVIADRGNNRVLIWDELPTNDFTPAVRVLGAPDLISIGRSSVNNKEFRPAAVFSNGNQIFVADDSDFSRILIWNSWPIDNYEAATHVLGTDSFDAENTLLESNKKLASVSGFDIIDNKLIVADIFNNRVVIFEAP